jgi:hypothetical protein
MCRGTTGKSWGATGKFLFFLLRQSCPIGTEIGTSFAFEKGNLFTQN